MQAILLLRFIIGVCARECGDITTTDLEFDIVVSIGVIAERYILQVRYGSLQCFHPILQTFLDRLLNLTRNINTGHRCGDLPLVVENGENIRLQIRLSSFEAKSNPNEIPT